MSYTKKNKFYQNNQSAVTNLRTLHAKYNRTFHLAFVIFTLGVTSASFSQNLENDSLQIHRFISEEKNQKHIPTIITITEKSKIDFISNYINQKLIEKEKKAQIRQKEYKNLLGRRCINGDKSAINDIIVILDNRDIDQINSLFDEMTLEYEDRKKGLVLDDAIKLKIFKLIENQELEPIVIQFLGYNRVEGFYELFENRLLSGKSSDSDRLFFWLAQDAKSEKSIDYLYKSYFDKSLNLTTLNWAINELGNYLAKGSANSKKKILDICYDFIKKNPIKKDNIKPKSDDYLPSNKNGLNLKLFGLILEFGDERNKTLLTHLLKEFKNDENFSVLQNAIKLHMIREAQNTEKINIVKDLLQTHPAFFDVMNYIKKDTLLSQNTEIYKSILRTFEKSNFNANYDIDQLIYFFKGMEKTAFSSLVNQNITDKTLKNKLIEKFKLDNQTFYEINNYLYENGIIDSLISEKDIELYSKKEFASADINSVYTCLEIAKISINFDTEPNLIPVDYDVLLSNFMSIAENKITGLKCFLQTKWQEKEKKLNYEFFVVYKDKCHVMFPEDFGDWYDIETFDSLLQLIIKETNIKEEFVSINTGDQTAYYIFGEREKINTLKEKFQLETEYTED